MAGRIEEIEIDRSRLRVDRRIEVGSTLLHLPGKEYRRPQWIEGILRIRLFQGRLAEGCPWCPHQARPAFAIDALDQVHLRARNRGDENCLEGLYSRSDRDRKCRPQGEIKKDLGSESSRRIANHVG